MNSNPNELPPVHTVTLGDGPRVFVLLHGWQKNLEVLRPLGELLAPHGRVVLIDLPGFGKSPLPEQASNAGGGWSTAQYAERMKEVLASMGITRCILIGHSFGGRISVRIAATAPELLEGVILIGSHGLVRERSTKDRIRISAIRTMVSIAKKIDAAFGTSFFKRHLAPKFGSADYKNAGELRSTLVKTVNENLSAEAAAISQPTLLLWGADDTETPIDIARRFKSLIKNSTLVVFPDKGHEPYADVGSHLLTRSIEKFLSERIERAA